VSLTGPGAFGNSIGAVYLKVLFVLFCLYAVVIVRFLMLLLWQLPLRESDPIKRLALIKQQTDSVIRYCICRSVSRRFLEAEPQFLDFAARPNRSSPRS
jgi:hypothetical protein